MRWLRVCFRNTRILLASNSSHTYTTRTVRKIIFQSSERLKRITRTCAGFIAQDALWETRALFDVTLEVCGLARRYLPYKCSTKLSFMWFGMQWTYIFKIWTSLTEGCFQFQMLTRFVCVDCSHMRLCVTPCKWFNVLASQIMQNLCKQPVMS